MSFYCIDMVLMEVLTMKLVTEYEMKKKTCRSYSADDIGYTSIVNRHHICPLYSRLNLRYYNKHAARFIDHQLYTICTLFKCLNLDRIYDSTSCWYINDAVSSAFATDEDAGRRLNNDDATVLLNVRDRHVMATMFYMLLWPSHYG